MRSFDLIVIGTGSGLDVAADASAAGMSVAIMEEGPFGGTCHNRGCIPSKMLIHSADVMETIQGAGAFGISVRVEGVDWQGIVKRVFDQIDRESEEMEEANQQDPSVSVYRQSARFVGPKTLRVGNEEITAETLLIAAGTRPSIPEIPGLSDVEYVTSDDAMRLMEQPRRLAVVGGGYIAAEMAHFFGALGTEVTMVYRGPRLLRTQDEQIGTRFTEVFDRKLNLLLNAQIARAYPAGDSIGLDVSVDGQTRQIETDVLLLATGRTPNTDRLDVSAAGVEVDDRGFVKTNDHLETNVPGIWALGDIVGRYLLKHSANLEAAYASHNMFNRDNQVAVDYTAMPAAIFSSPQVASVGLTEREAEEQGIPYAAGTYDYYDTAYGESVEDRDGFVKVLANHETEEILGCHIIGTDASVLIQEVANAMRQHLTTDAITQSIYVHPALPEVVQRAFGELQHG